MRRSLVSCLLMVTALAGAPHKVVSAQTTEVLETLLVEVPEGYDPFEVAAGFGGFYREHYDIVLPGWGDEPERRWIEVRTPGDTSDPSTATISAAGSLSAERDGLTTFTPTNLPISPKDPDYVSGRQWHHAEGTGHLNTEGAWQISDGGGYSDSQTTVGIFDTGVDCRHVDLRDNVASHHYDAVTRREVTTCLDPLGHGTHVAGIIGASANIHGGVGVAPNVELLSMRVCTATGCRHTDLVAAAVWSMGRIEIANYSLGGPVHSKAFADVIFEMQSRHNVVVVASGGNRGDKGDARRTQFPAGYPGVIGVCSSTRARRISDFSQQAEIDVCAPGEVILSTAPGGGNVWMSGTSMAAPMVTGVAALILSYRPSLTWEEVVDAIQDEAEDIQGCGGPDRTPDPQKCGHGLVNASQSIRSLKPEGPPPTPPPGSVVETATPGATPTCDTPIACGVATAKAATLTATTPEATEWPTPTSPPNPSTTMPPPVVPTSAPPTPTPCPDPIACAEATATRAAALKTAIHGTVIAPATLTPTITPNAVQAFQTVEARATRDAWLRFRAFLPVAVLGTGMRVPPTPSAVPTRRNDERATAIWCSIDERRCTPTPTPRPTRCPGISCLAGGSE